MKELVDVLAVLLPWIGLSVLVGLFISNSPKTSHWLFAGLPGTPRAVWAVSILCLLAYLFNATSYVALPGFCDHVEPNVIIEARMLENGRPVYHATDSASRYSLQYGPYCFILFWLATKFLGQSIISYKLLSACFAAGGLGLTLLAINSSVKSRLSLHAGLIYFCGAGLLFGQHLVWVRPDPQLLFWSSLGLWATTRQSPLWKFVLLGISAGVAFNTKIHGLFYFVPIMALVARERRWIYWGGFAVLAGLTLSAPFLVFPEINFHNYLLCLETAAKHGLDPSDLIGIGLILFLMLIPVLVVAWGRMTAHNFHGFQLLAASGSIVAIVLLACKKGAGGWYFIPFLPLGAWSVASLLDKAKLDLGSCNRLHQALLVALLVMAASYAILNIRWTAADLQLPPASPLKGFKNVLADAQNVARKYAGRTIAVGWGSKSTYWLSYVRAALPLPSDFFLDPCALMDFEQSGLELGEPSFDQLRRGTDGIWIIPKNDEPFIMYNWYEGQDLVGPKFRDEFKKHYKKTDQSEYFDVWTFQG